MSRRTLFSGGLCVALVLVGVAALAGCAAPSGVDGDLTNGWPAMSRATVAVPVVGACYQEAGTDIWYGDFNTVPCNGGHGSETVFVGAFTGTVQGRSTPPAKGTQNRASAYAQCRSAAGDYLGGDYHLGLLDLTLVLPSENAWRGGARWFRCDVVRYADVNRRVIVRTGSVKDGLRGARPLAVTCVTVTLDSKGSINDQQAADCGKPHNAELAGLYTAPDIAWPADDKTLDDVFDKGCEPVVARFLGFGGGRVESSYVGWMWFTPSEQQWDQGDHTVVCSALDYQGGSPNGARIVGSMRGLKAGAPKSA